MINKLSETDNNTDVYSFANSLLFGPKVQKLPTHDSVQDISKQFADYFIQKIVTIRNGLCQNFNTEKPVWRDWCDIYSRVTKSSNKWGNIRK